MELIHLKKGQEVCVVKIGGEINPKHKLKEELWFLLSERRQRILKEELAKDGVELDSPERKVFKKDGLVLVV